MCVFVCESYACVCLCVRVMLSKGKSKCLSCVLCVCKCMSIILLKDNSKCLSGFFFCVCECVIVPRIREKRWDVFFVFMGVYVCDLMTENKCRGVSYMQCVGDRHAYCG